MSSNETTGLSAGEEVLINTVCLYAAGLASKDKWDIPAKDIVYAIANLYTSNPEATVQDVLAVSSWTEDGYYMLEVDLAPMNETFPYLAAGLDIISHPHATKSIIPIFAVFTALSTIVMALRIWSRMSILGRIQSFDWVALISYLCIVAWCSIAVYEKAVSGTFASFCDRTFNQNKNSEMGFQLGMALYPIAVFTIKLALLWFYHQISNWKPMRIAVYITGFVSFASAMCGLFMWLFQCNYPDIWNHGMDPTLRCGAINIMDLVLATGSVNIITDVVIWFIPLPLVWKLQLYPRERILAVVTFGLGFLACIASIVRLVMVRRYLLYTNNSTTDINAWAMVELNLALICSSAPALRALIIKHAPKILSYAYATGGASYGSDTKVSKGEKTFVISQTTERSPSRDESA
ncbi:hypothetical protein ABW19_dt0210000 [Dactylella cylindrospora]|nr:hypothetical protein ABW19_dt0210000 [Dactylella cylindrospora]